MKDVLAAPSIVPPRPPAQFMRLSRMGAMSPTRLSFLRVLTRPVSDDCLPTDMLRRKLAFFGATRFGPESDRWTAQDASQPKDPATARTDDWRLAGMDT